jgi:hypothetical protein
MAVMDAPTLGVGPGEEEEEDMVRGVGCASGLVSVLLL